jgi:hypothetical protein
MIQQFRFEKPAQHPGKDILKNILFSKKGLASTHKIELKYLDKNKYILLHCNPFRLN